MMMRRSRSGKRLAIVLSLVALGAVSAFAADIPEIPFVPMSPEVMGRGGSFIADAHGYDAFFYNPAGFSRDNGSFTLGAASSWIYARPDQAFDIGQQLVQGSRDPTEILGFMNSQVTTGGLGAGASAGIGYVGNGLGLGMVLIVDSLLSGPSLLGVEGDVTGTVGFLGGLAVPLDVLGFKLHLGGTIRPMIRVHVPLSSGVALGMLSALATGADAFAALNTADALYGVGIGIDLGAIAELGWFTIGASIRDLAGTQFKYNQASYATLTSTFGSQMRFPPGTAATAQYVIPMDIAFGVALHPDFGAFNNLIDPSLSVDIRDIVGALSGAASIWTLFHAGASVKLFSVVTLSAGLNQGYLTAGAGLKLLFIDLNFAVFTRELGRHLGDLPNSGATLEAALRW